MSENYKVIDSTVPTFITIAVVDWVDLFVRPVYCSIIDDALNYCIKEKGLSVHAYVYPLVPVCPVLWCSFATSTQLPFCKPY